MKLDLEKEFPQPGLDFLRQIVASTGIDPSQADSLLHHLDSQNYAFIAHSIAKNSAEVSPKQAQNLVTLLQAAVQFIEKDSSLAVSQTLNELSFQEQQFLYEDFSAEFAADQDTNAANYQLPTGESNPFLDYLYQQAQAEAKSRLGQIWSKFTSPATTEAEAGTAAAATAGGVAAAVAASKISAGTALIPISTTAAIEAGAALPPAQILGFSMSPNIAPSVIGREYISFGIFEQAASQPGMSYFALTPKGVRLATSNPKLANVLKYVSSSPEVTTITASGTTTGTGVASAAAAKTAAGTAVKGAAQLATRAATQTAVTATGAGAGATAGSIVPIIGTIIGAVVGFVLGAVVGNWSKVKKEAEEGILALSAAVYLIGSSVFSGGVAAVGAIFAAISTIAVESAGAIVIIVLSIPIVVAFFLYIITNSAYLVPPSFGSIVGTGLGGIPPTLSECQGSGPPKPASASILRSTDNRYAYPVGYPIDSLWYGCTHWNGQIATDIGFVGYSSPPPQSPAVHAPVLAYTSGVITYTSLNDVLGGKNIILKGDDGRYYYYAHNCGLYINPGDRVSVGDIIATTDNTGEAATTVEHLHFGISNYNTFYGGGTICPATDFQQKFGLTRCQGQPQCR